MKVLLALTILFFILAGYGAIRFFVLCAGALFSDSRDE